MMCLGYFSGEGMEGFGCLLQIDNNVLGHWYLLGGTLSKSWKMKGFGHLI